MFLNVSFKGYNREEDVRYALSEDEIILEVRDRTAGRGHGRVKRIC